MLRYIDFFFDLIAFIHKKCHIYPVIDFKFGLSLISRFFSSCLQSGLYHQHTLLSITVLNYCRRWVHFLTPSIHFVMYSQICWIEIKGCTVVQCCSTLFSPPPHPLPFFLLLFHVTMILLQNVYFPEIVQNFIFDQWRVHSLWKVLV